MYWALVTYSKIMVQIVNGQCAHTGKATIFHQLPSCLHCHLSPASVGEWFAAVPYCTINELPRGSIDHSWLLLRWALLWAPPGLAFSHECPGTLPSVDLSDDWKVGIPASAERSLWEWIFSSCHPHFHWTGCIFTVRASMTTALAHGENRFRDQEMRWRFTPEKHQLNNAMLSLAVAFALSGLIFTGRTNKPGLEGILSLCSTDDTVCMAPLCLVVNYYPFHVIWNFCIVRALK